jgi:hypothetical protein
MHLGTIMLRKKDFFRGTEGARDTIVSLCKFVGQIRETKGAILIYKVKSLCDLTDKSDIKM